MIIRFPGHKIITILCYPFLNFSRISNAAAQIALFFSVTSITCKHGSDFKGKISVVIYALAILFAFIVPLMATGLYALVALMWLLPDRRIERILEKEE